MGDWDPGMPLEPLCPPLGELEPPELEPLGELEPPEDGGCELGEPDGELDGELDPGLLGELPGIPLGMLDGL